MRSLQVSKPESIWFAFADSTNYGTDPAGGRQHLFRRLE
jgi:hypothetical protein